MIIIILVIYESVISIIGVSLYTVDDGDDNDDGYYCLSMILS